MLNQYMIYPILFSLNRYLSIKYVMPFSLAPRHIIIVFMLDIVAQGAETMVAHYYCYYVEHF